MSRRPHRLVLAVLRAGCRTAVAGEYEIQDFVSRIAAQRDVLGRSICLQQNSQSEPRLGRIVSTRTHGRVAVRRRELEAGQPLAIGTTSSKALLAYPKGLGELDLTGYRVQRWPIQSVRA